MLAQYCHQWFKIGKQIPLNGLPDAVGVVLSGADVGDLTWADMTERASELVKAILAR